MRFHRSRKQRIEKYGYAFDNPSELRRYEYLMLRFRAGEITEPEVHPEFPVSINGVYCWAWTADFRYHLLEDDLTDSGSGRRCLGTLIVEDLKGTYNKKKKQTRKGITVREWTERAPILEPEFILKRKIVEALYEINVTVIWEGNQ